MKTNYIFIILIIVVIGGIFALRHFAPSTPNPHLDLAQCINDSGALFYGTFWCPYCVDQKRSFGLAESELPYVECSTPDRSGQTQICIDEKIETYPTWRFSDGTELTGVQTLQTLAEKTDCASLDNQSSQMPEQTSATNQTDLAEPPRLPETELTDDKLSPPPPPPPPPPETVDAT